MMADRIRKDGSLYDLWSECGEDPVRETYSRHVVDPANRTSPVPLSPEARENDVMAIESMIQKSYY